MIKDDLWKITFITLGSDAKLKDALTLEPFDRFQKFKGLNRLEFDFLFIEQTVSIKFSARQQDQRDKNTEIASCWYCLWQSLYW